MLTEGKDRLIGLGQARLEIGYVLRGEQLGILEARELAFEVAQRFT
jgi:hypothetical protein